MKNLPTWNLESVYSGFDDPEYISAMTNVSSITATYEEKVADDGLMERDPKGWLMQCVSLHDQLHDLFETLESYVYARFSTATTDEQCTQELNKVEEKAVGLKRSNVAFCYALQALPQAFVKSMRSDEELAGILFFVTEQLERSRHMMGKAEESLAAELSRSGGDAWSRLHSTISSTLVEPWGEEGGETKTVVQLRALAYDADRDVRQRAYHREIEAWTKAEIPLSYSINGVKGFTTTLTKRRNYADALDLAVFESRITRETLEALISAMIDALPQFRIYLKAKARVLGLEKLAFYDIFAPMQKGSRTWDFDEAKGFIVDRFAEFSGDMATYARTAFENGWIDALPRKGKVGGAYCTYFPIPKESRILCNFDGSFNAVSTVAHELGHGYHGSLMTELPNSQRDYPMTLAETASIFCESIVFNSAIQSASGDEKTSVLETYLQDSTQVIVDILSRYFFENELFKRRDKNELSPEELCHIMIEAQKQTYGDALDEDLLHPYMWAAKPHYYSQDLPFYNYPYAFGQLFGLGLYGRYETEGPDFAKSYRELLAATGTATANEITKSAGFDIEDPAFWASGIAVVVNRIRDFDRLTNLH